MSPVKHWVFLLCAAATLFGPGCGLGFGVDLPSADSSGESPDDERPDVGAGTGGTSSGGVAPGIPITGGGLNGTVWGSGGSSSGGSSSGGSSSGGSSSGGSDFDATGGDGLAGSPSVDPFGSGGLDGECSSNGTEESNDCVDDPGKPS